MGERCGIRHAYLLPYIFPFAEYCVFLNCICRSPLPDSVKSVLEEGINLYKLHTNRHGRLVLRSSKSLSPLVSAIRNLVSPPRFYTRLDWLILLVLWPCESNKFWGNWFHKLRVHGDGIFLFLGVLRVGILVGGGMERRVKKKFWKILNKETYHSGFPYST